MTFLSLKPRWVVAPGHWAVNDPPKIGVSFLCPHCLSQRLVIFFKEIINPLNIDYPWPNDSITLTKYLWTRIGDNFETITFQPSIDASQWENHWHGFVINGIIK